MRLFGHHVALPVALLCLCDLFLFLCSLLLALSAYPIFSRAPFPSELIDATVIRSVLLPSVMKLLGEWNWYLPRWLEWLPHVGPGGEPELPPDREESGGGERFDAGRLTRSP